MSHGANTPVESPLLSLIRARGGAIPSLCFTQGSDSIEVTPNATIDNLESYTSIQWVRLKSLATVYLGSEWGNLSSKCALFAGKRGVSLRDGVGTVGFFGDRTGTDCNYQSNERMRLNEWTCVAATWDINNVTQSAGVFLGTTNKPLLECTYASAVVGSGSLESDSAEPWRWGGDTERSATADYGPCVLIPNRVLTLAEMREWQFAPWLTPRGAVIHHFPGLTAGRVIDWSGNGNHGTRA